MMSKTAIDTNIDDPSQPIELELEKLNDSINLLNFHGFNIFCRDECQNNLKLWLSHKEKAISKYATNCGDKLGDNDIKVTNVLDSLSKFIKIVNDNYSCYDNVNNCIIDSINYIYKAKECLEIAENILKTNIKYQQFEDELIETNNNINDIKELANSISTSNVNGLTSYGFRLRSNKPINDNIYLSSEHVDILSPINHSPNNPSNTLMKIDAMLNNDSDSESVQYINSSLEKIASPFSNHNSNGNTSTSTSKRKSKSKNDDDADSRDSDFKPKKTKKSRQKKSTTIDSYLTTNQSSIQKDINSNIHDVLSNDGEWIETNHDTTNKSNSNKKKSINKKPINTKSNRMDQTCDLT